MLLHLATRTNDQIYRWTIQKHLKSPKCKFFEKIENIKHLYTDCKRNKNLDSLPKILQKSNAKRILRHILTISALSLSPKTKKLLLTLTITILTHTWKTRNRLKFDDTIIPTTNTIINIKNNLKNIIQIHYKQHVISNTLDNFKTNFSINIHSAQ